VTLPGRLPVSKIFELLKIDFKGELYLLDSSSQDVLPSNLCGAKQYLSIEPGTFCIKVSVNERVGNVRQRIEEITGMTNLDLYDQRENIQLLDHSLLSDHTTTTPFHLYHDNNIQRGGGVSFSFASLSDPKVFNSDPNAPHYRTATPGLCREGTCKSKTCKAYNRKVIINKGFVDQYHVAGDISLPCPECGEECEDNNIVAFSNCVWCGRAVYKKFKQEENYPEKTVVNQYYQYSGKEVEYSFLELSAVRISENGNN